MSDPPVFSPAFRAELDALFVWRRDVRRFRRDPLPPGTFEQLVATASLAPSVGLSEPWWFVLIESPGGRAAVRRNFERCNAQALAGYDGAQAATYAQLKLAGLDDAPCQFAVFADPHPEQGHGLGRATMPRSAEYSAVLAVHTMWLAARAQGFGLGWVSILDPQEIARALDVPAAWVLIGCFCLGRAIEDSDTPALQGAGWETRRPAASRLLRR